MLDAKGMGIGFSSVIIEVTESGANKGSYARRVVTDSPDDSFFLYTGGG
jgi:hypothetical protein